MDYFQDPKIAWYAPGEEFIQIGIPKNTVSLLEEKRKKIIPEKFAESIQKAGISWLTIFEDNYPKLLKEIYDPPAVLYYKGEIKDFNNPAIAIVGTRKMTGYGKAVAEEFAKGLSAAGLTIVSGLARGVDSQAHQTTVSENGRTIAVLGGGINNIFPSENRGLAAKIASGYGVVVSEFEPYCAALPGNFPARNRIISGLSLGVLVIEAAKNSGSLITAKFALDQGREVFAVPGPVTSALSKGPIELIQTGAKAVFSPDEVLEELGINKVKVKSAQMDGVSISKEEEGVLKLLENETKHIDELGRQLHMPSAKISALLLKMEISGLVQSIGAGIYCKK